MRRLPPACCQRDLTVPDAADDNQKNPFSNSLCLLIAEEKDRSSKTGISGLPVKRVIIVTDRQQSLSIDQRSYRRT